MIKNIYPYTLTVLVVCLITSLTLFDGHFTQSLTFSRQAIDDGAWWRIFTGQFIHLNFHHTLLNVLGYFLVCTLFRQELNPAKEAFGLVVSLLGVGLGIYYFSPELDGYYGLSGAINGLLVFALILASQTNKFMPITLAIGLTVKLCHEQFYPQSDRFIEQFIGGTVAFDSHLYGAVTGLLLGIGYFCLNKNQQNQLPLDNKTGKQ